MVLKQHSLPNLVAATLHDSGARNSSGGGLAALFMLPVKICQSSTRSGPHSFPQAPVHPTRTPSAN